MDERDYLRPAEQHSRGRDYRTLQATVLGSMLQRPKTVGPVLAELTEEDFSGLEKDLYIAIRDLFNAGSPVEERALLHRIDTEDVEDGWPEILQGLKTCAVEDPLPYCRMLRECVTLDRLRDAAFGLQYAQTMEDAEKAVAAVNACLSQKRNKRVISIQDAVMRYQAELQEKYKKGRVKYLDWGIDYLTEVLDSELGDFVVIGGYPSAGKTLLSLQCDRRISEQHRVGYFSFETGARKLTQRLLTAASGVPLRRMKHNDLHDPDYRALAEGIETLYALPFSIVEAAGMTVSEIQAVTLAERFKVIFVDYLQLVNQSGSSRYEKVTEISQQLHRLAQEHGVLVVALAQLSRPEKASKDSKPTPPGMSSLRESGQIEQDADAIALLYPENPNDRKSLRVLKIAKNKEGEPVNPCKLELKGEVQLFEEQFPERPRPAYDSSKKKPGQDNRQESLPL